MRLIIALVGISQISGEPSAGPVPGAGISPGLQNPQLGKDLGTENVVVKPGRDDVEPQAGAVDGEMKVITKNGSESNLLGSGMQVFNDVVTGNEVIKCKNSKATLSASVAVKIFLLFYEQILLPFAYWMALNKIIALNELHRWFEAIVQDPNVESIIKNENILSDHFNRLIAAFVNIGERGAFDAEKMLQIWREIKAFFKCEGEEEVPGNVKAKEEAVENALRLLSNALNLFAANTPEMATRTPELADWPHMYSYIRSLANAKAFSTMIKALMDCYKLLLSEKVADAQAYTLALINQFWETLEQFLGTRFFNNVSVLSWPVTMIDLAREVLATGNQLLEETSELFSMILTRLGKSSTSQFTKKALRILARCLIALPRFLKLLAYVFIPSDEGIDMPFTWTNGLFFKGQDFRPTKEIVTDFLFATFNSLCGLTPEATTQAACIITKRVIESALG